MAVNILMMLGLSCVGLILVALAVFFLMRTRSFISRSREAKATVTQMVYTSDGEGGGYSPVYRFRTLEGQEIEATDNISSNPPQFKVGQVIDVLYDPQNPGKPRIKKWSNLYFVPMLLGFLGLVFGCIGVGMAIATAFGLFNQ